MPSPLWIGREIKSFAIPSCGASENVTLVGVASLPGCPSPSASGTVPSVERSTSVAPPGVVALPRALLAYGPRALPGVTVAVSSIRPLVLGARTSVPCNNPDRALPLYDGSTLKSGLMTASTT